jgi:glycosyltransferase involved in cell wall biosynthesis
MKQQNCKSPQVTLVIEDSGQGGTEVYVEGLARYLKTFLPVEIITLSGSREQAEDRFPNIPCVSVDGVKGLGAYLRGRPDTVVSLHLYTSLLPAVRMARKSGAYIVTTLHIPLAPWNFVHRFRWRLAVWLSHRVVGVSLACHEGYWWKERASSETTIPAPFVFEPNATAPRTRSVRGQDAFEILFVGRLEVQKDVPTLLRAVSLLDGVKLTLLGDGKLRAELEALSADLGVDATFRGAVSQSDVRAHLDRADVFVLPSKFEGLGIAAIEAMAMGVPTITADFPASADFIVQDQTGLTFPRGDSGALADALMRLMTDDGLCKVLSQNSHDFVKTHFSVEGQYSKYLALFGVPHDAQG